MSKEKELEVVVIAQEDYNDLDNFKPPAKYFFLNAFLERVYIKCRDRKKCQEYIDKEYGGRYTLRTESTDKAPDKVGAVGKINSNSRKGAMQHQIKNRQGY